MPVTMPKFSPLQIILFVTFILFSNSMLKAEIADLDAEKYHKPFILAQAVTSTDTDGITSKVKRALKKARFEIVGQYSPYANTNIIIISSPKLRRYASQSENGIYGAIQRVSITTVNGVTQLSFTNPTYMAHAYRMKTDLSDISRSLKKVLGFKKEFGSKKGATKYKLRRYQYQFMMMPNFTDRLELAEYPSQQAALKAVQRALDNNSAGVSKVYQVSLKGKNETVIGVKMEGNATSQCSGDEFIMKNIDFKKIKSSPHLPYEMIIQDGVVYALFAEFRIAMNFPDLAMVGDNSFMSIMCTPDAIIEALTLAAGGEIDEAW